MTRRRRGLTLLETVVVIGLISLVTSTVAGLFSFGMQEVRTQRERLRVEQAARTALAVITSEFRQAAHSPLVAASIIVPASDNQAGQEIVFTEPDPGAFAPTLPVIDNLSQSSYQRIRYYVQGGNTLRRECSSQDQAGNPLTTTTCVVASLPAGSINLTITRIFANAITIEVRTTENRADYRLACQEVTALAP